MTSRDTQVQNTKLLYYSDLTNLCTDLYGRGVVLCTYVVLYKKKLLCIINKKIAESVFYNVRF